MKLNLLSTIVATLLAACVSRATGEVLTPIARWDVVPYQRINPGETLNCGVVAFSKTGIARVEFTIISSAYTGSSPVDATEMLLNEQTGVYEYWVPIAADDFTSDGLFTVEAKVFGTDGGMRDKDTDGGHLGLDALTLFANSQGTLPANEAWVHPTAGDDASGAVNDPGHPYATMGGAMLAIQQAQGGDAGGGIVRLMAGVHVARPGEATYIVNPSEWLTVTTARGGTTTNTVIQPAEPGTVGVGWPGIDLLHIEGIGLQDSGAVVIGNRTEAKLWLDHCDLQGSGRYSAYASHPVFNLSEFEYSYLTNTRISEVSMAVSGGARLCRNIDISTISDDAFQNVPLIINCTANDLDAGSTGNHADAVQFWGGNDVNRWDYNTIIYGLVATGLHYQSLFARGDIYSPPSYSRGMAFVNVYMDALGDHYGHWARWVDHMLWWNCSFAVLGMGITNDSYYYWDDAAQDNTWHDTDVSVLNFSCVGCDFAFLVLGGTPNVDWSGWQYNHFVWPQAEYGFCTVGDPLTMSTGPDLVGTDRVPLEGSPLLQRLAPLVPVDVRNKCRGPLSDVGPFQRIVDADHDGIPDYCDVCINGFENGVYGDADQDGDVDPVDFAALQRCLQPQAVPLTVECLPFDFNCDQIIGLPELAKFEHVAAGAGTVPADPQ